MPCARVVEGVAIGDGQAIRLVERATRNAVDRRTIRRGFLHPSTGVKIAAANLRATPVDGVADRLIRDELARFGARDLGTRERRGDTLIVAVELRDLTRASAALGRFALRRAHARIERQRGADDLRRSSGPAPSGRPFSAALRSRIERARAA